MTCPGAEGAVRVGGRVVSVSGRRLAVADATHSISAELSEPSAFGVAVGDLVVVKGTARRGALFGARICEHYATQSEAQAEFERLHSFGIGRHLEARARALGIIRRHLQRQGFTEVDTPQRLLTAGLDRHIDAIPSGEAYLCTSPEHHMKRLLVGGMPRIFQLCHCFRADELGPLHEPEFMMLEWYRAFSDVETVMLDTEQIVHRVIRELSGAPWLSAPGGVRIDVRPPFPRMTVRQAFQQFAQVRDAVALANEDEDEFFQLLVDRVEPGLAALPHPTFITHFPYGRPPWREPCPTIRPLPSALSSSSAV